MNAEKHRVARHTLQDEMLAESVRPTELLTRIEDLRPRYYHPQSYLEDISDIGWMFVLSASRTWLVSKRETNNSFHCHNSRVAVGL